MAGYSKRYDKALTLAASAHRVQKRKGSDIPYIVHPVHVSVILLRHGFSEDIAIAGLLHDVVEDQDVPLDDIEADFGATVAEMVATLSEKKREGGIERRWEIRKREKLEQLRTTSLGTVAVKAADSLHNARSLASDLRRQGPSFWANLARGPELTLWYYRSIATIVRQRLGAHPLVDELDGAVQDLEQAVTTAEEP
jgi:(p)ppGpp synthase/HD superfamily hydrolase